MKSKIIFLSVMLFCVTASIAQVQVSREPRHKNVLENKYIRLLNVWIQPGDTIWAKVYFACGIIANVKMAAPAQRP